MTFACIRVSAKGSPNVTPLQSNLRHGLSSTKPASQEKAGTQKLLIYNLHLVDCLYSSLLCMRHLCGCSMPCWPHKAVNPHRQRLLVAAHKAVQVGNGDAAEKETKGKPKATAGKTNTKPKAKATAEAKAKTQATVGAKPDTIYNIEKKKFVATLPPSSFLKPRELAAITH